MESVGDFLALRFLAPAAFVESKFGIDEIAAILEQPSDAIKWAAAFFICGESDDDVTVGLEAFFFVLDQVGDPDGRLGFVVASASAVEKAIALDELKRVHTPVFALGFDDINVGEKENRLEHSPAVIANDQIGLLRIRAAHKDIGIGNARGAQASGGRLGNGSGGAGGEAGLDFDKFLVNIVGEFFLCLGARGLGTE